MCPLTPLWLIPAIDLLLHTPTFAMTLPSCSESTVDFSLGPSYCKSPPYILTLNEKVSVMTENFVYTHFEEFLNSTFLLEILLY